MPTGYTSAVQDGTITEFSDFAMRCARNFGALILMRDDPMDASVPDEFKPSDHYAKTKAEAEARLAELVAMDAGTAHDAAKAEFEAACADVRDYRQKAETEKKRYRAMLDQVMAWTPPTPDHEGLKRFMIQQLQESIEHDCDTSWRQWPTQLSGKDWLEQAKAKAQKDVGYYTKEMIEEEKRSRSRTEWVRSLKKSLKLTAVTT